MSIVTRSQLDRACEVALQDFEACGLATPELAAVPVRLIWMAEHYGFCDASGAIEIPALSLDRLREMASGVRVPLEDVLRHEFAHALAHLHPNEVDTPWFAHVFGSAYWDEWEQAPAYDPDLWISEYATSSPCEDFAETVMVYVRERGDVAHLAHRPGVMHGIRFVRALAVRLQQRRAAA